MEECRTSANIHGLHSSRKRKNGSPIKSQRNCGYGANPKQPKYNDIRQPVYEKVSNSDPFVRNSRVSCNTIQVQLQGVQLQLIQDNFAMGGNQMVLVNVPGDGN